MIRVEILEDYGSPISLHFGAETIVPMNYGGYSPGTEAVIRSAEDGQLVDRESGRIKLDTERRWPLNFFDAEEGDSERTVLLPDEVAVHYFGNWLAGTDAQAVREKRLPSFNTEREKVAARWGDYLYAGEMTDGKAIGYATIRMALPRVPKVELAAANAAGNPVGEWRFRPATHWRFEEMLDPGHSALLRHAMAKRGSVGNYEIDLGSLHADQIAKLGEALMPQLMEKMRAEQANEAARHAAEAAARKGQQAK